MACVLRCGPGVLCLLLATAPLSAQDLDPRAYARVPVDATFLVAGFSVSHGGVVSDPTLPGTDIDTTYHVGGRTTTAWVPRPRPAQ
jgi:hypothetical protein